MLTCNKGEPLYSEERIYEGCMEYC